MGYNIAKFLIPALLAWFVLWLLWSAVSSIYHVFNRFRLRRVGQQSVGVVVTAIRTGFHRGQAAGVKMVVRYSDGQGAEHDVSYRHTYYPENFPHPGTLMKVWLDPKNPARAEVDGFASSVPSNIHISITQD